MLEKDSPTFLFIEYINSSTIPEPKRNNMTLGTMKAVNIFVRLLIKILYLI